MTHSSPPPEDAATQVSPQAEASQAEPVPERSTPTLLEQLGGVGGLISSVLPVLVFVLVNTLAGLQPAIWSALGAAVAIGGWRL
ncbi:MAG TPA: DUF3159 domain-containing protein, partial [Pseudonocardiaceae bacterium]|nr:DUF3159 domain-containing protein [Pseudonocardiaceae bacterium]